MWKFFSFHLEDTVHVKVFHLEDIDMILKLLNIFVTNFLIKISMQMDLKE